MTANPSIILFFGVAPDDQKRFMEGCRIIRYPGIHFKGIVSLVKLRKTDFSDGTLSKPRIKRRRGLLP